jgi:pimeloyl-ACP methyl ester carboxylesterase
VKLAYRRFAREYRDAIEAVREASDDPTVPPARAARAERLRDWDFFGKPAADELVAGIEGARSIVLPGAGHFLWADQPEAFREEVGAFLLR